MGKILFVHIPKTARQTIINTSFVKNRCRYHAYSYIQKSFFYNKESFCVVRNPYDRLVSAYCFILNGGKKKHDLIMLSKLQKYPSFNEFCKNLDEFKHFILFKPIYEIITKNKCIMVKHILKLEDLQEDFNILLKTYNYDKFEKLKVLNKTFHENYKTYYDKETQEIVYHFYKKDFELFDYKKEL